MKFHNQRSFMGHEISNVNNKPLLRKKGKQWIVVAVSALILAGFGGMVSMTTHADTTNAQPTTTKVAPKPANTSANVMKQAQGMHKALANNAAVQKPSAPSSAAAKTTAPASATSTSAKSNSVSASSSASSQASSSVNSASVKSSSVSSNSNSSNNKATKPAVRMLGMGAPVLKNTSSTLTPDNHIQHSSKLSDEGNWGTATWNLYSDGQLDIHDGSLQSPVFPNANIPEKVKDIKTYNAIAPVNSSALFGGYQAQSWGGQFNRVPGEPQGYQLNQRGYNSGQNKQMFDNVSDIDLSGLDTSNVIDMSSMFHGMYHLKNINFGSFDTHNVKSMYAMFDDDTSMSDFNMNTFNTENCTDYGMLFTDTPNAKEIDVSSLNIQPSTNVSDMFGWSMSNNIQELVINNSFKNLTNNANLNGSTNLYNPITQQHVTNWSQIANTPNPSIWINNGGSTTNNANVQTYNVSFYNESDGASIGNSVNYYGMKDAPFLPVNTISVPNGYQLAKNVGTTAKITSPSTAKIAVTPKAKYSGTWGNANWNLYDGGQLRLTNGALESKQIPSPLNQYANEVTSISTKDITAPSNASDIFKPFTNDKNLDLSGFDDSQSTNKNLLGLDQYGNGTVVPTITLGNNAKLTGTFIYAKPNGNNTSVVNIADDTSHPGTYENIIRNKVNYIYPTNKSDVAVTDNTKFNSDNNAGTFQPISQKGLSTNVDWNNYWTNYGYDRIPGDWNTASWVKNHEASDFKPNINSDDGSRFTFSNPTPSNPIPSHNVIILPNIVTDTVQYVDIANHQQVGSNRPFSGFTSGALDNNSNVLSNYFIIGKAPKGLLSGYGVLNPDQKINYDGGNYTINVAPEVTNHINFTNDLKDNKSTSGIQTTTINISAPSRYHFIDSNFGKNTIQSTYKADNFTQTFAVAPNSINVDFINKNTSKSVKLVNGINTKGCSSNNFNMPNSFVPTNYKLANGKSSDLITFSNGQNTYNVDVLPLSVSETIDYKYNNNSEGSNTISGLYNSSSEIISAHASGINPGWHLASNSNFTFNSGSVNVNVAPNTISDMIKYQVSSSANVKFAKAGQVLSTETSKFNDSRANVAGNTSATIMSANNKYVPTGYHMASNSDVVGNKTTNSASSSTSDVVTIVPNSESEKINYVYNNNINKPVSSSTINGGYYDNSSSVASNTVPNGWQFAANPNNSFTFGYKSNTDNVNIAPNVDTDTVDYQSDGKTLASQTFSGNDEHATQAGDNSFDVTAKNDSKIPSGYELVNSDNTFGFDNSIHDVAIQPIPQSVPYIMPTSSAAAPVTTVVAPTSEAPTVSKPASHYRYAKVITPLQLHTSKHFTKKNGVLVIKHPMAFKIMKIVHDHKLTRYEVKYQGHNYFITGNDHFTINNYVQKHDFKSHKHMMVKVITPMIEYKHAHFNRKYAIKVFKKGAILPVKRVFTIGKGEMTRFELTNGRFVTSNKLFVKVIK